MARSIRKTLAATLLGFATLASASANAAQGDWLVRFGASVVDPKSDNLTLSPGTTLQVGNDTRPSFDITYMFRDNWGVELLASTVWKHELTVRGPAGTSRLGQVSHLPPTISLQYHFTSVGRVRPYVGLGLNYTFLFNEGPDALSVDNSFGPAAQIGLDVGLGEKWVLNLAARYIDIDANVRLGGTRLGTVEIDPVVYDLQIGYRLGH